MDTWWWLALGAVVALSLVAALVDGGARLGRPFFKRLRGGGPSGTPQPGSGPRPGEIWWTNEPLLVLVLAVRLDSARVARVSAERPSGGGESRLPEPSAAKLALPPGTVADAPGRVTALRTDEAWDVALSAFRKRAGEVDQDTWVQVRHLAGEE